MSAPNLRYAAAPLLALALFVSAGTRPAAAQTASPSGKDLLDETRRTMEIARQKIEADVRSALSDSLRITRRDPEGALTILQKALKQLDDDTYLTDARRQTLIRTIKDRIRLTEASTRSNDRTTSRPSSRDPKKSTGATAAEREQIRQALKDIATAQKEGLSANAERQALDLIRRYPNNTAAHAMARSASMTQRLADARSLLDEQDQRILLAMREVEKSALPPIGDVEYPKDWAQKMAKRKGSLAPLSEKEKALLKALGLPVAVDFRNATFADTIQYLSDAMGQPILLDKSALEEAQVTTETTVNFSLKSKVAARTALRKVFQDVGLTYIIKDEAIQVTSPAKARETLTTRVYYVGDLVAGIGPFGGGATWGPGLSQLQMFENVNRIVELIQTSLDPSSWKSGGGPGTITFSAATMSLIVRQTAEVHTMLRGSFNR